MQIKHPTLHKFIAASHVKSGGQGESLLTSEANVCKDEALLYTVLPVNMHMLPLASHLRLESYHLLLQIFPGFFLFFLLLLKVVLLFFQLSNLAAQVQFLPSLLLQ